MKWFFRLFLVVWSTSAVAQTVSVRSGEHESFTRLVFRIPSDTDWQISQTNGGYRLSLDNEALEFDLSTVFERIPRTRLIDVSAQNEQLDLTVTCLCHLDAFRFQPDLLVVDLRDGSPPSSELVSSAPDDVLTFSETETFEEVLSSFEEPTQETAQQLTNRADSGTANRTPDRIELPLFTPSRNEPAPIPRTTSLFAAEPPRNPNLAEAERAILESFARAATQGIFDFPARPLLPQVADGQDPALTLVAPMTDPMDGVARPLAATDPEGPGFLLRTSIDREVQVEEQERLPQSCPDGINFHIATWGSGGSYADLIPALQLATINIAGQQDTQAIFALAEANIYYGFGLEARRNLESLPEASARSTYLNIIADLVDGNSVDVSELLPFRACSQSMELWIVLATGRLDTTDTSIHSAILMAARGLPDPLRGHLGIQLAQAFAQAGLLHNAQEILEMSRRTITGNSPEAQRTNAGLAGRLVGPTDEADQLDEFITTSARAAPEDMIRLMEIARQEDVTLGDDIFEIAETMRFEAENSATRSQILEAEVSLQLEQGHYQKALDLLAGDVGQMTEARHAELKGAAMIALTQLAPDDAFLSFAFSNTAREAPIAAEHAIAERLIGLGFPAQAYTMIEAPITGALNEAREKLQARALTDLNTFAQDGVRTGSQTPVEELVTAWRNGEWESLRDSHDPLLSSVGRARLAPLASPSVETPLADTRNLLEQAQESRDLADDLLSRFAIEGDPAPDGN